MNARGEQIQNNENIKADLLGALKESDLEIISEREDFTQEKTVNGLKKYWGIKWEEWQDFFWANKGSNENADNGFNEFLKCVGGLEQYLIKIEFPDSTFKSNYELISLPKLEQYIENFRKLTNEKDIFTANYSYFLWIDKSINRIWELFNNEINDWFIDYGDDKKAIDLNRMAFIWPIFYYQNLTIESQDTDELYRVLRLFYVRLNNNIRAVKSIKGLVDYIAFNGLWSDNIKVEEIAELKNSDGDEEAKNVKTFLNEEALKHKFLNNLLSNDIRKFEELFWEIEDHPINLNGRNVKNQNISHLLDFKDTITINDIISIKDNFYKLFPLKEDGSYTFSKKLQTILLHYGKFHQKVGPDYLDNYDFNNWRRIVRNIDGNSFDNFFKDFRKSNFILSDILDKKELEFFKSNNEDVKNITDLYNQLIIYSLILKDEIWENGGRIAVRNWEDQDGLFVNSAHIYKLKSNFVSYNLKLWALVPDKIKNSVNETTIASELYHKILKDE